MITKKTIAILLLSVGVILVCAALLIWLSGPGQPPSTTEKEKVRLRLKWVHQGQFAGFYVAKNLGFYEQENLDVEIRPGGQEMNAVRLVTSGTDDIGVWGAEQNLLAQSRGIPIVSVGVVYQETAACYMVRADSGIDTFKDIEGKKVGVQVGTDHETIYETLLTLNDVDRDKVKEINVSYNLMLFLSGQVDVWPSYLVNEPYVAKQNGIDVKIITPKENGLHFYGDTLFCTHKFANEKKDTLKGFLKATMRGWNYALSNPEEAARICLSYDRMLNEQHQAYMIEASKDFIKPPSGNFLRMTDERWLTIHKVLKMQGLLERDVPVSEVYTNEFIP